MDTLTEEQAAEIAKCSTATLRKRLGSGTLAGAKVGRHWVIPRDAFLHSLNNLASAQATRRQPLVPVRSSRRRPLAKV